MIIKIDKWNKTVNTVINDKIVPMSLPNNDGKLLEYDINLGSYIGCRYADIGDENTRKFFDLYKHTNGNHMSNNLLKWCQIDHYEGEEVFLFYYNGWIILDYNHCVIAINGRDITEAFNLGTLLKKELHIQYASIKEIKQLIDYVDDIYSYCGSTSEFLESITDENTNINQFGDIVNEELYRNTAETMCKWNTDGSFMHEAVEIICNRTLPNRLCEVIEDEDLLNEILNSYDWENHYQLADWLMEYNDNNPCNQYKKHLKELKSYKG